MSDLIDRQAAIDGLRDYLVGKRCPDDGTLTCRLIENEVINKLLPIQSKLLQPWEVLAAQAVLPQPEIVRCKDCKHYWIHKCMDSMPIERCDLEQTFYDPERDFCSLAEKREGTI